MQADSPGRALSRREQHHRVERPAPPAATSSSTPSRQFAQIAERGKFDFLFLAEGLRLREQNGQIYDLDVVGRPDTFTVLAALAAVTEHMGLTGTINSTFNEPYEVARQFASLDHLSGGRAAWNVVTSWDAFTGENFRRGGFLAQERPLRAGPEFLAHRERAVRLLARRRDRGRQGVRPVPGHRDAGTFRHQDAFFDIAGQFNVPRRPQGRPVIFQAGDSDAGPRLRRRVGRRHLLPARHAGGRAGLLRRRQGPAAPVTAAPATSC